MNKQKLMPQAAQPVTRFTTGQLPAELAELSEEVLQLHSSSSTSVLPSLDAAPTCTEGTCGTGTGLCNCVSGCICCAGKGQCGGGGCCRCSYDGDDAE
jgi:bacteriocin leader peptide (microcyclamide/patellamide family)